MIIKPKVRGFLCTTAHPQGCRQYVQQQIDYVKSQSKIDLSPKKVLVVGASTGYGLASRIAATYSLGADTIGVYFDKGPTDTKTAAPGWYNTFWFDKVSTEEGFYSKSINSDAFSSQTKEDVIRLIKDEWGGVDMLVYSLAAPRRTVSEVQYASVLKPVGSDYQSKNLDLRSNEVSMVTLKAATEQEITSTVKVMGGEDWQHWITALKNEGVLNKNFVTVAYSYIGPEVTHAIYRNGTVGFAKQHLENTANEITVNLSNINGKGYVSVNKALVTQASMAIPVVGLYISILYKIMKSKGIHENCIEQIYRLFKDKLFIPAPDGYMPVTDLHGRLRVDDWEMREDVQREVTKIWDNINSQNVRELSDIDGYYEDFYKLFGFGWDCIDYEQDTDTFPTSYK